jgi:MFS family permease
VKDEMPSGLKAICWVSFLWSLSTLMVYTTLSLYQEQQLHFSKMSLGSLQAYSTLAMHLMNIMSGVFVDFFKNHKVLLVTGSILSGLTKPLLGYTTSFMGNFYVRTFERITKGMRAVPTDAYISTIQKQNAAGFGFAWKQIAWGTGASLGCVISSLFLWRCGPNFKLLYTLAAIPTLIATIIIIFAIKLPKNLALKKIRISWQFVKKIPHQLWKIFGLVFLISLARFGETFMGHRFHELGMPFYFIPLIYIFYDLPVALASGGMLHTYDRKPWLILLMVGTFFLLVTTICFFFCQSTLALLVGVVAYGLHIAVTHGLFSTLIARHAPLEVRGTAYGLYHLIMGFGLFISNHITGYFNHLFDTWCAGFGLNAIFALLVLIVCACWRYCETRQ